MKIHPYGDGALFVDLEMEEHPGRARRTRAVARALAHRLASAEIVLGAGTIAVVGVGAWDDLDGLVAEALSATDDELAPRTHAVAAVYDGPDLDDVARLTGLSVAEVIALHAASVYEVELIGFLPGFAYLVNLDPRLVVARRPAPRPRVPRGTLAIAGPYTGIYPATSPGGWHLIGRVLDVELFDPARRPPGLFAPGDAVRFVPRRSD